MSASILSTAKALTASRQDWLEGEQIPVWEGGGIAAVIKRQGGYVGLCFTVNHKPIDETYTLLMLEGSTWHPFIQDAQAYDNWRKLIVPKINQRLKPRVTDDSEALWVTEPDPETPTETFLRRIQQQMAIKGLTDRGDAFPRIGTLRKGWPKPYRSVAMT